MLTLQSLRTLIHPPRLPPPTHRFLHSSRPTSSSKPPFSWSDPSARSSKPVSPLQNAPSGTDNPLEQVRKALELPVPKVFPELLDKRLEKLLFSKPTAKEREGIDQEFIEAYHPRRLEFCGDKILGQVVVDTLFLLAPVQPLKAIGQKPSLTEMGNFTGRLVTNDFIATLSAEFKLEGSLPPDDLWEAALAALAFSNGRQAFLNFFVPIVKREFLAQYASLAVEDSQHEVKALEAAPAEPSSSFPYPPPAPSEPSSSLDTPIHILSSACKPFSPPARAGVDLWSDQQKRKGLSSAAKLEPLEFDDLTTATRRLLDRLQEEAITFSFRRVERKLDLRLPGYPRLSVTGKKSSPFGGMETLVSALIRLGAVKLSSAKTDGKTGCAATSL